MAVTTWMLLLGAIVSVSVGSLLDGVEVPLYAVAGGRVNVTCKYDLEATGLYSLKWYHNDTEFYRYVPTETHRPVDIKPTIKFQAHEVSRTEGRVTLSITSMTQAASGEYKCEVIAEHPSFRTETSSAMMTVLDKEPKPPVITGVEDLYEEGDVIKLRCRPESVPASGPAPSLTWTLQGRPARREYVHPYRDDIYSEDAGTVLKVPATEAAPSGGLLKVECVLRLGSLVLPSEETLRVKVRQSSYLSTYFSSADPVCWSSAVLLSGVALALLLH